MIIGIAGKARSGKDTVGKMLMDRHGFRRTAFADPLKEGAAAVFGLSHEQLYGELKDVIDKFWQDTPRNILQKFGTECLRRGYRDDIWVKCVERIITEAGGNWVVTDVRFPNEAEAIKSWGGLLFLVKRPGIESAIATNQHTSETALDSYEEWDGIIPNDGTIDELHEKAWEMIARVHDTKIPPEHLEFRS